MTEKFEGTPSHIKTFCAILQVPNQGKSAGMILQVN